MIFGIIISLIFFDFRFNSESATAKLTNNFCHYNTRSNGRLDLYFMFYKLFLIIAFTFIRKTTSDVSLIILYSIGAMILFMKVI